MSTIMVPPLPVRGKQSYSEPLPGLDLGKLTGLLIVVEGADSSGRSTQIAMLTAWLEQKGYAVTHTGLTSSELVGQALDEAKLGNVLSPRTMSLFYATDFYARLENTIVPALRAGYIVLADRYIFTLMARDRVRGANPDWVESLYSRAIVPDAVFLLNATPAHLVDRTLNANHELDYWESGMDLGISRDWYESFIKYQYRLRAEFLKLQKHYDFHIINANRSIKAVQKELRGCIERVLDRYPLAS